MPTRIFTDTDNNKPWSTTQIELSDEGTRLSRTVLMDDGEQRIFTFDTTGNRIKSYETIDGPLDAYNWQNRVITYATNGELAGAKISTALRLDNGNTTQTTHNSTAGDHWTERDLGDNYDWRQVERKFNDNNESLAYERISYDDGSVSAKFYDTTGDLTRTNDVTPLGVSTKVFYTDQAVITEISDSIRFPGVLDFSFRKITDFNDDRWDEVYTPFGPFFSFIQEKYDEAGTLREYTLHDDPSTVTTTYDENGVIESRYSDKFSQRFYLNEIFEDGVLRISERTELSKENFNEDVDTRHVRYFDETGQLELRAEIDVEKALGKIMSYEDGKITDRVLLDIDDEKPWAVIDIDYNADGSVASREIYRDGDALPEGLNVDIQSYFDYDTIA